LLSEKNLNGELDLIDDLAEENPKCYQLWHHRQLVVEKLNDPSRELEFIADMLADDSKNYHAWSYRQWVVKTFNLWNGELPFIESMIDLDIRNNSAWNQRFYVLKFGPSGTGEEIVRREIDYAIEKIMIAPHNESPWNYLAGVAQIASFEAHPEIELFCRRLLREAKTERISPHLLGLLVDICSDNALRGNPSDREEAVKICQELETKHDTIRSNYWSRRKELLVSMC